MNTDTITQQMKNRHSDIGRQHRKHKHYSNTIINIKAQPDRRMNILTIMKIYKKKTQHYNSDRQRHRHCDTLILPDDIHWEDWMCSKGMSDPHWPKLVEVGKTHAIYRVRVCTLVIVHILHAHSYRVAK